MDVTFTKLPGRRYQIAVVREHGPQLASRQGPGYDDFLPHDAVHFLVEVEAGLSGGVYGRIAAGQSNIFWPADPAVRRRQARREARRTPTKAEQADMLRSERLASICQPLWAFRTGQRSALPLWYSRVQKDIADGDLVDRIVARLDEFAERWHALPVADGITLTWPDPRPGRARGGSRERPGAVGRARSPQERRRPHARGTATVGR